MTGIPARSWSSPRWTVTANVIVDDDRGYVVFGSSGAPVATTVAAGVLLIVLPLAFNAAFAALAAKCRRLFPQRVWLGHPIVASVAA
ncbi:hypothetical protein [Pseudarthrobacter sp. SSS035]|uniref:hypothetical protein n=1 Tax=Pseudarthrobacter sp. SSS035 TaxID=2931399 RepID=UPI00200CAE2F|nr:hypothetical protein [Pseudarthrobacter sp. SSS035]